MSEAEKRERVYSEGGGEDLRVHIQLTRSLKNFEPGHIHVYIHDKSRFGFKF